MKYLKPHQTRQHGFVVIELLFGLIVFAIASAIGVSLLADRMDSQNYQIAAQQQQQVAEAASKYLKDNFSTVYASAGTTTPSTITPQMLRNTNYLPAGFSDTNAFGQTFVVLARRVNVNQLESIVITTGGQAIDEIGTRAIAENIGAPGGFIPYNNTGVIQGVRGGWQLALSNYGINPGVGHTASALFLQDGTLANDYLYRNAIPGKPELNRMNTALSMGGNNVNDVAALNASGTVTVGGNVDTAGTVTAGGNVSTSGTVAAQGNVNAVGDVNAQSVNASANLTGAAARISGETVTGGWFRTQGDTGWYSEKWGGGWYMSDSDWVRVYGDKNLYTAGNIRGGTVTSEGRATVGEYLQLNGVATAGTACAANGMVGRTSTGRSLSCDNQVWVVNGSSAPTCTAKTINGYDANDATTYSCPVGYTKVGWDTTGSGQRNSSTPGIVIGQNDYATIFCCQF
ncbi:shufflon system plasmid conjugative transfer pilus tip adhesin PilV [Pseudomonas avellanae]|uniref:Shufflon system plasmid conjugative transfer pilus tip adhesin PilV n=3 Tax=Pseudomonas syringae group TaxID=136849 RepID=A0A261WMZ3_9PSED|nr:shufflon system plasmid conjugative transfer pilus tip adhesin PilV [Pseudomonas syringae]OZI87273.1 shufflon system plasmid conjugative transfer pilus tip adhesin PilV [Pseudomonas avellanae]ATV19203.1 shufflon system plasmid conjugative transfer pilus tip adhesin PilV [Pseudomonas syringae pv. actinidiae]PIN61216.1 shufflon system plasmid conjugative transfer pilus tip adhesin PilV [Pseudomonas syringae pv. actinidiae]RMT65591.1 Prepilin [Pseudomonas syringae pv. theae]GAO92345.1 prepilin